MILIYLYWLASILIIFGASTNAGTQPGLSAFGTSLLSFFAGAGLRGSFYYTWKHIAAGSAAAIAFMAAAHWIRRDFWLGLFGYVFTGSEWGWLGFFICLLFTPKRFAQD